LHNWIEDFDLRCYSSFYISLFASAFFLGQVLGTPFLAAQGDKHGRVYILKRVVLVSLVLHLMMLTVARKELWTSYVLLFFQGIVSNVRGSLAYLYGQETVHQKDTNLYGSLFNIVDALTMTLLCLYFKYISKHWIYS
jgi:MFS family permease